MKLARNRSLETVRKRFRRMRDLSDRTLQDLAHVAGISISQISEFETGTGPLRNEIIRKLEKYLFRSLRTRAKQIGRALAAYSGRNEERKQRSRTEIPASAGSCVSDVHRHRGSVEGGPAL